MTYSTDNNTWLCPKRCGSGVWRNYAHETKCIQCGAHRSDRTTRRAKTEALAVCYATAEKLHTAGRISAEELAECRELAFDPESSPYLLYHEAELAKVQAEIFMRDTPQDEARVLLRRELAAYLRRIAEWFCTPTPGEPR